MALLHYNAVLIGDVSGNWQAAPGGGQLQTFVDLSLTDVVAMTGEQVAVPLSVQLNGNNLYSLDLALTYDPAILTIEDVTTGSAASNVAIATNLTEVGTVRVGLASAEPLSQDGVLLEFAFDVAGDLEAPTDIRLDMSRVNEGAISSLPQDGRVIPSPRVAQWDGNGAVANVGDGSTWGDANNWTVGSLSDRLPLSVAPGDDVVFGIAPTVGTIDLGTDRVANSVTFMDDYVLVNHTLSISSGQVSVGSGVTATIASEIVNPSGLVKTGDGALIISGVASDVTLDGGTLGLDDAGSLNNLTINTGNALLAGIVTGDLTNKAGTVSPAGAGNLVLPSQVNLTVGDARDSIVRRTVPDVYPRFDFVADDVVNTADVTELVYDKRNEREWRGVAKPVGIVYDVESASIRELAERRNLVSGRPRSHTAELVEVDAIFSHLGRDFYPDL